MDNTIEERCENKSFYDIRKFRIVTWNNEERYMTAQELFKRVEKDSESNYGWIASATELYKTCHIDGFPKKYSIGIMLIILNCFANLELSKTIPSYREETAQKTLNNIYAELSSEDETVKKIKDKYLRNIIKAVTMYDTDEVRLKFNAGRAFYDLEDKWQEEMFEKYVTFKELNFKKVQKQLYKEYEEFYKKATADEKVKAEMEAEQKKYKDSIGEFIKEIVFKD